MMDYERRFEDAINRLKAEERYRVFANLERDASRFPMAMWRPAGDEARPREVTVWCSNDYLGMGGHEDVIEASVSAARAHGAGRRRHSQHFRHPPSDRAARDRACRPARQACLARLHLGLGFQSRCHPGHREPPAELPHFVRRGPPSAGARSTSAGLRLFGEILRNSGVNWSPLPMLVGTTGRASPALPRGS